MTTIRDQYFSCMVGIIKEIQKIAAPEAQRYLTFLGNSLIDAQKLSDEEIDGIIAGDLEYRPVKQG